ncbi:hypothetical protein CMI42_04780 [Candidatus Pacearchaeota archaeon]|nr:hypothetical protein [Candidatus Pacearchaeota archaeon]|tara:strand:- start:595 stop:1074 length:480 start_codon:yes stop_codon:yes gene_type:complete
MTHDIKEPWRPLREGDRQELKGLHEGYIEKLANGKSLLYMREGEMEEFTGCPLSYFAYQGDGNDKLNLVAQMVKGRVAMHNSGDVQCAHLYTVDLPGYLSVVSTSLEGLLPHFNKTPAKNEYFQRELKTLKRIDSISKKLREGRLDDESRNHIFWMCSE